MAKPPMEDLRNKLPTNPNGGTSGKRALSKCKVIAVHYNGPPVTASEMNQLIGDARYHAFERNWGKDPNRPIRARTITYHIAIGQSGKTYLLNDFEDVTWHLSNGNPHAIGILCIMGKGQKPSAAMLASLKVVVDWLVEERPDISATRADVWGHGECGGMYGGGPAYGNNTECPGPYLLAWVRDYRKSVPHPTPQPLPPPKVESTVISFEGVGIPYQLHHGFKALWEASGGIAVCGYPISDEYQTVIEGIPLTVQDMENVQFEWAGPGHEPRIGGANRRRVEVEKGSVKTA